MSLSDFIVQAFEDRLQFSPTNAPQDVRDAVAEAIQLLDSGKARVAEKINGEWVVNQWLKKAVLLSFRLNDNEPLSGGSAFNFTTKYQPNLLTGQLNNSVNQVFVLCLLPLHVVAALLRVMWC
jgi:2,3,4,5-tetrahydropyridine-2,6-dicarboxylate N-succinyltransferase